MESVDEAQGPEPQIVTDIRSGIDGAMLASERETQDTPPNEITSGPVFHQKHPAAGSEPPFPLAEPGEYYIGLWSGLANYGCPYCSYSTLDGSGAVELHILAKADQGDLRHLKALDLMTGGLA